MSLSQEGYQLGARDGDAWWFLDTRMTVKVNAGRSGGAYTLIECEAGQGFGTPRHVHEREDETFYVLDGELLVVCGTQQWHAAPGSLVFLPRGIEHALLVTGDRPFRGLQITNPAGFEAFISELGRRPTTDGLPDRQMPDVARMDQIGRRTGRIVVGPPLTP